MLLKTYIRCLRHWDIYKILIIGWNVDIDCKFTIMYVNFWIAWFSSCSIMWYVISRREYVNLGSYRGIFQQYMLPKIRFNLYMVEDLHQNYLYIFAVDFVFLSFLRFHILKHFHCCGLFCVLCMMQIFYILFMVFDFVMRSFFSLICHW